MGFFCFCLMWIVCMGIIRYENQSTDWNPVYGANVWWRALFVYIAWCDDFYIFTGFALLVVHQMKTLHRLPETRSKLMTLRIGLCHISLPPAQKHSTLNNDSFWVPSFPCIVHQIQTLHQLLRRGPNWWQYCFTIASRIGLCHISRPPVLKHTPIPLYHHRPLSGRFLCMG